jgi:hypothetical protein
VIVTRHDAAAPPNARELKTEKCSIAKRDSTARQTIPQTVAAPLTEIKGLSSKSPGATGSASALLALLSSPIPGI